MNVYIILNETNRKVYIGSTKNLKKRIIEHKSGLKTGKHYSQELVKDYSLGHKIVFESLETCSEQNRFEREEYYINLFQSFNKEKGYNKSNTAKVSTPSLEGRLKHSLTHKGKVLSREIRDKIRNKKLGIPNPKSYKVVVQLSIHGKLIRIWQCMSDIQKELCINISHISSCCNHKPGRKTVAGFKWMFYTEYVNLPSSFLGVQNN